MLNSTRTAGPVASPQLPVILTASYDLRFYEYMLGVVAINVSEKYSVHVNQSLKNSCIRKKGKNWTQI